MPYFSENNIFFVHVPRTAGTSIEYSLGIDSIKKQSTNKMNGNIYGYKDNVELDHATIRLIHDLFGKDRFDNSLSFAVKRNPINRLASTYRHFNKYPQFAFLSGIQKNFYDFCLAIYRVKDDLHQFPHYMTSHLLQQKDYIFFENKITVKHLLKFENLENDYKKFVQQNSLKIYNKLPNKNRTSDASNPRDTLKNLNYTYSPVKKFINLNSKTTKLLDMIFEIYEQDFLALSYEMKI